MLRTLESEGRFPRPHLKCIRWDAHSTHQHWQLNNGQAALTHIMSRCCTQQLEDNQYDPRVRRLRTPTVSIGKSWVTCCLRYVNNTKKLNGTDDMWVVSFRVCVWCALAPKNLLAPQANATGQHNLFVINRRQEPTQSALWRQRFN